MPYLNPDGRIQCQHVIKTGVRKGVVCGKLLMKDNEEHCCGEHRIARIKKKTQRTIEHRRVRAVG